MDECKPCRHCRQNDAHIAMQRVGDFDHIYYVQCHSCGACTEPRYTREAAIRLWNLRVSYFGPMRSCCYCVHRCIMPSVCELNLPTTEGRADCERFELRADCTDTPTPCDHVTREEQDAPPPYDAEKVYRMLLEARVESLEKYFHDLCDAMTVMANELRGRNA